MVYHVLELYLFQKKNYKKRSGQIANVKHNLIVTYICLIIISILWIINLFIQIAAFFIAEVVVFVVLVALLFIMEQKHIKKSNDRVKNYDEFLKELKRKMNINGINWAGSQRLEYLIAECDRIIRTRDRERKKIKRYVEVLVLPIGSFIADILKDKIDSSYMPELLALIIAVLIIVFFLIVFINLIATVTDLLLKIDSITEMKNLRNVLMDIKNKDL